MWQWYLCNEDPMLARWHVFNIETPAPLWRRMRGKRLRYGFEICCNGISWSLEASRFSVETYKLILVIHWRFGCNAAETPSKFQRERLEFPKPKSRSFVNLRDPRAKHLPVAEWIESMCCRLFSITSCNMIEKGLSQSQETLHIFSHRLGPFLP